MKLQNSPTQDYESLKRPCLSSPYDKVLVTQYIRAYEDRATIDQAAARNEDDRLTYLKLKWIHDIRNWEYLNEIGNIYLRRSKYRLSFMCLAESLRLNPDQSETHKTACHLFENCLQRPPIELAPTTCKVSVIIRTCGARDFIKESIQSVLDQTLHDFELVVINDGGDDGASQIVNSFNSTRIRYYKLPENRGPAVALNEGILHATGEYIAYLDDDDVYYPNHLEILTALLDKHPHQALAYSNAWWCFGAQERAGFSEQSRELLKHRPRNFDKAALFQKNYISTLNVLQRKSCVNEVGLFNEDLTRLEDWDMWMRLAMKYGFCQVNKITGEYRWHQDNMTNRDLLEEAFVNWILIPHYEFGCGKVGLMKSNICQSNRGKAERMFGEMLGEYHNMPRTASLTKELFQIGNSINNRMRHNSLTRDYFWLESRNCLRVIFNQRKYFGFLLVADLFFLKLLRQMTRLSKRWLETQGLFSFKRKRKP